jgi:D-alanyl-D-alanine carboxypeptidase/D-alanyl-D-alanine-endopeptidase (penicillin-binding protein 4)
LIGAQSALLLSGRAVRAWRCAGDLALSAAARWDLFRRAPPLAQVIADANLPGRVGCAVADAATGEMLEVYNALYPLAAGQRRQGDHDGLCARPAGAGLPVPHTLVTDGTLADGRLEGDLWLVGGGDPLLDTDALDDMARALVDSGLIHR